MRSKNQLSLLLCTILVGSLLSMDVQGFIEREYAIHEILDACTNVVFGEVKSVDTRRLRGIIKVKEDAKGKSNLSEIKVRPRQIRWFVSSKKVCLSSFFTENTTRLKVLDL